MMEDDIDIEEHDLLDNPHIRTIFPDLAQIKQEIPEDQYHDPDQKTEYSPYHEDDSSNQEKGTEHTRLGSKIILGSKPINKKVDNKVQNDANIPIFGRKSIEIKQEVEEFEETDHQQEGHEYHPSTVLILGSKPSNSGVIEPLRVSDVEHVTKSKNDELNVFNSETDVDHQIEEEKDPTTAFVLVENWGPRLENSPCYCKDCEILFPTRNTLLAHNTTAHSFLVAVDVNRAKKSTAKPNESGEGKWCNHCNKMFPDSDSLINHLYEKLTFDKNNATFKTQPKKVVANPIPPKRIVGNVKPNIQKHRIGIPGASIDNVDKFGLKKSVYMYRCEICSFYCQIHGFFLKHMQSNHGIDTASKERVVFTGVCLYCNARMKTKPIYNNHIKLVHSDVFNSKGPFPKAQKLTPKKQEAGSSKQFNLLPVSNRVVKDQYNAQTFQCQKCSEILPTYQKARQHREIRHPESASLNIFKKITNFNNKSVCIQKARVPAKIVLKYPIKSQKPIPQAVPSTTTTKKVVAVPKNLFKCHKCTLHYTSCTATVLHAKTCTKQEGEWKCNICKRDFQEFDGTVHRRQHQVCNKFNVIVYAENIYGKVLNRCPKCNVCFHEKDFFVHEQKNICKGAGVQCEHCTYPIHPSSAETHRKWHERIKFSKKDVIVVEFATLVIEEKALLPVKRTLDFANNTPTKKAKMDDFNPKTKVFYCEDCGIYLFKIRSLENHVNGVCKNDPKSKNKKVCKVCGLAGISKCHMRFHQNNPKITLMDMKFVALKSKKVVLPPIPNFPRCDKCEVHFGKQETVDTHSCDDSYKTCEYCQKRFSDMAYKLHVRFHEYHTEFRQATQTFSKETVAKKPKLDAPLLPELLQKYEKLTNIWNILFSCVTCDIVCDSYDKAVEHSQKHFNNMESFDVVVKHCDICGLNFDGTSFEKHAELHTQNKNVVKDSFTIQPYKYYHLFSTMWLKQFRAIPQSQLDQILSRSMYRYGRSVKLRVVQPGAPEHCIYRCGICEMFIHPASLTNHYKNVSCRIDSPNKVQFFKCQPCGIQFASFPGRQHHEKMHKLTKSFTVVYFNEDGDEEFNETLRENDTKRSNALGPTDSGTGKAYHYYRCVLCKVCIGSKDKALVHKCAPKFVRQCHTCQLHFHINLVSRHIKLHELNPRFVRKNIKCTPFKINKSGAFEILRDEEKPDKPAVKLYKCQCGLHFTSAKVVENHFEVCGTDTEVAKEKCSKCDRLFDTSQLVTHLCKHHSQDDEPTVFDVINVTPNKANKAISQTSVKGVSPKFLQLNTSADIKRKSLYHCKKCNIYYLSPGGLVYHFETNHQLSKVKSCPDCKLRFMPLTLKKHIRFHHQNLKCTLKDFIIHVGTMQKNGQLKFVQKDPKAAEAHLLDQAVKNKLIATPSPSQNTPYLNLDMSRYSESLFKCDVCNAHFLTYNGYNSHIFSNKEIDPFKHESVLTSCPECDYTFRERSLSIHLHVHHKKMNLNREDFNICSMPGTKVGVLDDQKITQLKRQLDKHKRKSAPQKPQIKPSISRKPLSDVDMSRYTKILYKCDVCNAHFLTYKSYHSHITTRRDIDPMNHESVLNNCPECDYAFRGKSLFIHRIAHHQKMNLKREDFIVNRLMPRPREGDETEKDSITDSQFSDDNAEEDEFEQDDQKESEAQLHVDKNKPRVSQYTYRDIDMSRYCETLYKCDVCKAHFMTFNSYYSHVTKENNDPLNHVSILKNCPDCNYTFRGKSLLVHRIVHHQKMKLNRNDLKIKNIMPKSKTSKETDKDSINNSQCSDDNIEEENKSSIGDTTSLHKSVDESNTEDSVVAKVKIDVEDVSFDEDNSIKTYKYSSVLFKCEFCEWTSFRENVEPHIKSHREGKDVPPIACACGLQFSRNNLVKHELLHHEKENLGRDDLYVITLSLLEDNIGSEHIFRCGVCHVYFIKLSALDNHFTYVGHNTPSRKCLECGLTFQRASLPVHVRLHHEIMKLKREDFILLESVGKTRVKIAELGEDLGEKEDQTETAQNENQTLIKLQPKYKATLHKCGSCGTHFLTAYNLSLHKNTCPLETELKVICEECQLQFSKHNLIQHKEKHHKYMRLKLEDFEIIQIDAKEVDSAVAEGSINTLPEIDIKDIVIKEEKKHKDCMQIGSAISEASDDMALIYENDEETDGVILEDIKNIIDTGKETVTNDMVNEKEIPYSLDEHIKIEAVQSTSNAGAKSHSDNVIKLYKCAVCNVCFLSQVSCYKHATKHVTLDPKDYIECKLCGYQFLILNNCLHKHITKHHNKTFKPEDVLIEEYHPDILCHGTPKINIYFGTDKLQSKLISTTCDSNVSSIVTSTSELETTLENDEDAKTDNISGIITENDAMDESVLGL